MRKSIITAQWKNERISLSVFLMARAQFLAVAEYFKGFLNSANLFSASVAKNGSISLQWHHTACGRRGGRPKSNHGQTMAAKLHEFSLVYANLGWAPTGRKKQGRPKLTWRLCG